MLLNQRTLHSATGKYLIKLIKELLSIVPAEDYMEDNFKEIRSKVEYIESIYNNRIINSENI